MNRVLIDTSAWIPFFRNRESSAVARIDRLLEENRAAVAGPVFAEVVSGATSLQEHAQLSRLLRSLVWLPEPEGLWTRAAESRFLLARQGVQAGLVDLLIAIVAADSGATLLTRDRDFERIRKVLSFDLEIF